MQKGNKVVEVGNGVIEGGGRKGEEGEGAKEGRRYRWKKEAGVEGGRGRKE